MTEYRTPEEDQAQTEHEDMEDRLTAIVLLLTDRANREARDVLRPIREVDE